MRKEISGWVILAFAFLVMTGCFTQKKAEKQLAHVTASYPKLVAQNCGLLFPVKTLPPVVLPGKETHTSDTVVVAGVKIPCPPGGTDTLWMDCPPTKIIHDTIRRVDTLRVEFENTAKIEALKLENDDLNKKLNASLEKITDLTNGRNNWRNIGIGLIVLFGVSVFLKFKKII